MLKPVFFLTLLIYIVNAAPTPQETPKASTLSTPTINPSTSTATPTTTNHDVKLDIDSHIISIERFETLLRHAGEIFNPASFQLVPASSAVTSIPSAAIAPLAEQPEGSVHSEAPYQEMQPPTEQPYNFYLPLFEYENTKLDAKSRKMEKFAPPPAPSKDDDDINYYAAKPKKLPKKFNGGAKHVNIKWLNTFQKEALNFGGQEMPKAAYLANDERNRINFDDSFFAEDMHVQTPPNNEPHKEPKSYGDGGGQQQASEDELLNQGEETGGEVEDLWAAPAIQIPQINFDYRTVMARA